MGFIRITKGQQAVEFGILVGIVFLVGLVLITIFGERIADFFQNPNSGINQGAKLAADPNDILSYNTGGLDQSVVELAESKGATIVTNSDNTVNVSINGINVNGLPSDTQTYLNTTGSSGLTKKLTDSLDSVIDQFVALAATNPEIASLTDDAKLLAQQGYILSDSEQWIEYSAKRIDASASIVVPDENMLCQNGNLKTVEPSCDSIIEDFDLFYKDSSVFSNILDSKTQSFIATLNSLKGKYTGSDEKVLTALNIINQLGSDIVKISDDTKSTYAQANDLYSNTGETKKLDQFLSEIASTTTDSLSSVINTASP